LLMIQPSRNLRTVGEKCNQTCQTNGY
jgi:hypothetical protein